MISDGKQDIYAAPLAAGDLNASLPVKTNAANKLISSKLDLADINGLDNVLTNPRSDVLCRGNAPNPDSNK